MDAEGRRHPRPQATHPAPPPRAPSPYSQLYSAGVLDCAPSGGFPNHAVAVVAHEVMRMPSGETWKVFTIKNSWGKNWGARGYVKVRDCSEFGRPSGANLYGIRPLVAHFGGA
jgi:hypothetical protein